MTTRDWQDTAFLLPGQGSQFPGMLLDLPRESSAAAELLKEVDAILGDSLGRPLTEIMSEGSEEELKRTEVTQLAIAVASLALLAAIKEHMGKRTPSPAFIAGHSSGQLTALAVAGVLNIEDTFKLIQVRGHLMQQACEEQPGGMVALMGIDEFAVNDVCRETGAYLATINGAEQIIISGSKECLVKAIDLAAARGAKKCTILPVSGAFHSELMASAQPGLIEFMKSLDWHDAEIPIISNRDALPLICAQDIVEEIENQIIEPVRWRASVRYMRESGIETFLEIGPKHVLLSLVRRIDEDARRISLDSMNSIREFAA